LSLFVVAAGKKAASDGAMEKALLKYLERRVPRYTSYPTAAEFNASVDAQTYRRWLAAVPAGAPVSIYLHVPFCAGLCLYCGCNTTVVRSYAPVAAYAALLRAEIAMVGARLDRPQATQIHWGGGSPTLLQAGDLQRIMAALRTHFVVPADAEIAIEIDPRTMTREQVAAIKEAGVTRASLGVQDFEERVQRAIGRRQSFEQTARLVDWLRDAGIVSINLDLMYGLPHQTAATLEATVSRTLELTPDRVALFGYAHVPWLKRHQKLIPEHALPDTGERVAQSAAAADVLVAAGYRRIGLDHFARPDDLMALRQREGRLHRNFQGYTTDESSTLIGFGTSAISALPAGYVQNAAATTAYRDAVGGGRLATVRGRALSEEDRLRRHIIERLMCDLRADLAAICACHGRSTADLAAELWQLDELQGDGLVRRCGDTIEVPEDGRPFVRSVCAVFDAYLADSETRFSRAS
jgi:oxygen-independent coproporphyrinogen-3 oxidase